jgi:hypothetical protein
LKRNAKQKQAVTAPIKCAVVLGILVLVPVALGLSMTWTAMVNNNVATPTTTSGNNDNESSTSTHSTATTTSIAINNKINFEFGPLPARFKIAFVKPVFTATAYSSFYNFYNLNIRVNPGQIVTTHLNLLNASLVNSWGYSGGLWNFINSQQAKSYGILPGNNSFVISDVDVDQGALFYPNGTRKYDAAVIGFTEYVTQKEYYSYKLFVMTGGRLILLDADNFFAQVAYYPSSNKVALLLGHWWEFNGTAAWRSVGDRWLNESKSWVGSRDALYIGSEYYKMDGASPNQNNTIGEGLYKIFGGTTLFWSYNAHEENILDNSNDSIIARWNVYHLPAGDSSYVVAAYELKDGNQGGLLIHSCVFGSDIIGSDTEFQVFLREAIYPNAVIG